GPLAPARRVARTKPLLIEQTVLDGEVVASEPQVHGRHSFTTEGALVVVGGQAQRGLELLLRLGELVGAKRLLGAGDGGGVVGRLGRDRGRQHQDDEDCGAKHGGPSFTVRLPVSVAGRARLRPSLSSRLGRSLALPNSKSTRADDGREPAARSKG